MKDQYINSIMKLCELQWKEFNRILSHMILKNKFLDNIIVGLTSLCFLFQMVTLLSVRYTSIFKRIFTEVL